MDIFATGKEDLPANGRRICKKLLIIKHLSIRKQQISTKSSTFAADFSEKRFMISENPKHLTT
jgi:hypothetical protein